jgi:hypothetical protein
LISSRKHIERAEEERVDKARMVALGDRLFNKHMKYLRDLEKEDVWQPAAGLDDIHFVQARATAHRRAMETIDLVTAYLQADLNSPYPIYAILEKEVIDLLPDDEKQYFKELEARGEDPVCEIIKALYGLGRSGFAFGVKFANWLGPLAWIDMHEAPAVAFKWHPESCEVEMQRAFNAKKYVEAMEAEGRDVLGESLQHGTVPIPGWSEVYEKLDKFDEDWQDARRQSGSTNQCSLMAKYVDDVSMDGEPKRRKCNWAQIKLLFDAGCPGISEVILSMKPNILSHAAKFLSELSQAEYARSIPVNW